MTTKLLTNGEQFCPKCSHKGFPDIHYRNGYEIGCIERPECPRFEEHMDRTCRNCGYVWAEKCR